VTAANRVAKVKQIFTSTGGLLKPPYLFVEPVLFQMLNQY